MARRILRVVLGLRLWRLRRLLRQAEVRLGWLGWQCADFGESAEPYLDQIRELESRQGELANRGAQLASELAVVTNELTIEKAKSQAAIENLDSELTDLRQRSSEASEKLELELKMCKRFALAQQGLQTEHTASAGGAGRPLYIVETELCDVTAQLEAHERESDDARRILADLAAEVREREVALRSARREQSREVRKLMSRIRKGHRYKTVAEKALHRLEKKKAAPYGAVGRIMADSGVGAANQPESLTEVEAWRDTVSETEARIAESYELSAAAGGAALLRFYFVCGCVLFLAALAVLIFWRE